MVTNPAPTDARPDVARKSSNPLLKALGGQVRSCRTEMGLTQEDLAGRVSMAPESISRLESGRLNVSVTKLGLIADALGVSVADLLAAAPVASPAKLRAGERRILGVLDGLDAEELKSVHAGLKHLLSVGPKKRRRRKPT